MKQIDVVVVMGILFNSISTPTRWNGSKNWKLIYLVTVHGTEQRRNKIEGGREICSEEEEKFVMRRKSAWKLL